MEKYTIMDSTLTGIADAIRGKTGSTDAIQTDQMAALIESIDAGDGEPTIVTGTFIPSSYIQTYTVQHNLGKIPKVILIGATSDYSSTGSNTNTRNKYLLAAYAYGYSANAYTGYTNGYVYAGSQLKKTTDITSGVYGITNITETEATFSNAANESRFKTGVEYTYVVMG